MLKTASLSSQNVFRSADFAILYDSDIKKHNIWSMYHVPYNGSMAIAAVLNHNRIFVM